MIRAVAFLCNAFIHRTANPQIYENSITELVLMVIFTSMCTFLVMAERL